MASKGSWCWASAANNTWRTNSRVLRLEGTGVNNSSYRFVLVDSAFTATATLFRLLPCGLCVFKNSRNAQPRLGSASWLMRCNALNPSSISHLRRLRAVASFSLALLPRSPGNAGANRYAHAATGSCIRADICESE